jgi:hypothetical protein
MNNVITAVAIAAVSIAFAWFLTHTYSGRKYVYYGHILLKKGLA